MQNNSFTDNLTTLRPMDWDSLAPPKPASTPIEVELADDGQTYTATAEPRAGGGQTDDNDCENFTINQRGTAGVSGSTGVQACWR